ncbi:hypothetical protein VST7929_02673 [Vibrio stylophorae]|uniref:N-acetyltransferase domain-containing protein n=1 Tax=Vibrio stylophorae TaxID=659351 RepID=A0ABM8ZWK8_9VIBR|nr:GNAT family N-acetyltransferase [Vibrio stylophorae]CAH0534723.1 hypothetical protein VST7929_02673 [Vibrio stylophorae]
MTQLEKPQVKVNVRLADIEDIDAVLALHRCYQVDTIAEEDRADGFVTTNFSVEELTALIQEQGLILAFHDGELVGYVMAASWQFWSAWPMFQHMISLLPETPYGEIAVNCDNSYQYGPVCVHKSVRGHGVLEQMFDFALAHMSQRFDVLITFVNHKNPRSFAAHSRKLKLDVVRDFGFNGNQYYWMACPTKRVA